MKNHLYEFRSENRKLLCSCGWERTIKGGNLKLAQKTFTAHRVEAAAKA